MKASRQDKGGREAFAAVLRFDDDNSRTVTAQALPRALRLVESTARRQAARGKVRGLQLRREERLALGASSRSGGAADDRKQHLQEELDLQLEFEEEQYGVAPRAPALQCLRAFVHPYQNMLYVTHYSTSGKVRPLAAQRNPISFSISSPSEFFPCLPVLVIRLRVFAVGPGGFRSVRSGCTD